MDEDGCSHHPSDLTVQDGQDVDQREDDYPPLYIDMEAVCGVCGKEVNVVYRFKTIERE